MTYRSRWSVDIPECSFPTFVFGDAKADLGSEPCFLDASHPGERLLTRSSFKLWSQRLAIGLRRHAHFQDGDRVVVFSGNSLAVPVAFFGIVMAGGVFSGANPSHTARELAHQLRDSGASVVLCADVLVQTALEAAKLCDLDPSRIFLLNDTLFWEADPNEREPVTQGCRSWDALMAPEVKARNYAWPTLDGPGDCDKTIALNYSSGTTGMAKGVEITHRNYVANTLQLNFLSTLWPDHRERTQKARWLCYLPLYHALAQTLYIACGLQRKIPVYLMAKFYLLEVLNNVQRFRITDLALVPPIAVALVKHPATRTFDLSSISAVTCGAAPLSRDICQRLEKVWDGKVNVKQGWGMTEVTSSLLGWDPTQYSNSSGVGELNPNCEARIMQVVEKSDGTEEFIPVTQRGPDHTGELWVRGPNVMKGYWRNPSATANTFVEDREGRWLRTGDVAYVDHTGCFFIVDRIKELIKVKGNQVAPAELEALILEHPDVVDVAVIGKLTEEGDEKPCAFVQKRPGATITSKDIEELVRHRTARFKWLAGGVHWIDAVPKNPSGKILRRHLRDLARQKPSAERL
ncbi:4-coumarate-CoA ligase [Cladophialophora psammophila CBS 110553]|uniref:4-coumarate-CoA ligase n=1 Tax=Cladophialophora psammophila CBS 110553 TaxID=1182543 RepID=W9XM27_9EURO|nr:4-coumarate-CoA ligase [Cladophialophora psammophila CBS 110553]EXJ71389.1 4-coumarate-CoA ligase [Cladophialophora psammophila CBS 110553]